ncbi:MAG: uroporphyrinogen-III synthase [Proteobacteria bacterium]|nr:uroporphyrinogen-III synthase [Pseudomonadota bacterium]
MKILITRPEPDASRLAEILKQKGHESVLAPMMTITNLPGTQVDVGAVQALLVTSANGARALGRATAFRDVKVYAVGSATADAVRDEGFADVISADGDVPSLANMVIAECEPGKGRLIHVAGTEVAGDLSGLMKTAGFDCERAVLYEAKAATEIPETVIKQLIDGDVDLALFYSPRTAAIFVENAQKAKLSNSLKSLLAACLSEAVAAKIAGLPWSEVKIADAPKQENLLALLDSMALKAETTGTNDQSGEQNVSDKKTGKSGDQANKAEKGKDSTVSKSPVPETSKSSENRAASAVTSEKTPPKSRTGLVLVLLIIVFCLGLAGWPLIYPKVEAYLPEGTKAIIAGQFGSTAAPAGEAVDYQSEINAVQTALKADVSKLSDRISSLEQREPADTTSSSTASSTTPAVDTAAVDALSNKTDEKFGSVESQLEEQLTKIASLTEKLEQQEASLGGLKNAGPQTVEPSPEMQSEILDLKNELLDLKTRLTGVQSDLAAEKETAKSQATLLSSIEATLKAEANNEAEAKAENRRTLLLLAIGQLQRESRSDEPFENGVAQVAAVADDSYAKDLATLKGLAPTGAETLRTLRQEFSKLAPDISQSARLPSDETWYGQTLHRIASAVKIRRVDDVEGDDVDAVIARAEQDLASNDLDKAIAEVKKLTGASADIAKDWLTKAESRLAVDQAIAGLLASATQSAVTPTTSN